MKNFILTSQGLSFSAFVDLVRNTSTENPKLQLSNDIIQKIQQGRDVINILLSSKKTIYGINTGFGDLVSKSISVADLSQLQYNLILSHAVGLGPLLSQEIVRGALLLLINSLSKGKSGIRLETINILIALFNENLIPIVPKYGSLGASGDLAPLAHIALVLLGLGNVKTPENTIITGLDALNRVHLNPQKLEAKEGLALINGTHFMTATLLLAVYDLQRYVNLADINVAMCLEALEGNANAFNETLLSLRPYRGGLESAKIIRTIINESKLIARTKTIQDGYSIRCSPQVHGIVRDTLSFVSNQLEIELNAVTDNPIILDKDNVYSGGLFHGEPISMSADFLGIAVAELGSIAERRINRLLDPNLNKGLPPFLINASGLNSGLMIVQYTIASIVSENRHLSLPNSIDNIPVSAQQEDFVSMGLHAALKVRTMVDNLVFILAGELLCLRQALAYKERDQLSPITQKIFNILSKIVNFIDTDREMHEELNTLTTYIKTTDLKELVLKSTNF